MCWPFSGQAELAAAARAFLAEGLDREERVAYLAPGHVGDLQRDLDGLPGVGEHLVRGRLQITDIATLPASDPATDPVDELIELAAWTKEALDAGYTGLRLMANGSGRVAESPRLARFVRYEHLIDRFCLDHALTVLCAFDIADVGVATVAELGCVHALMRRELLPFQLRAASRPHLALAGSVDVFCVAQLVEALGRIGVARPGARVVVDAVDLEFMDVRSLLALDRYAGGVPMTLVLRSPPSIVARLFGLVELGSLRVEPAK